MSVCQSVCPAWACNSKTEHRKIVIGIDIPQGMSKWSASFQLKGQRSRSRDVKTTQTWHHVYLRAAGQMQTDPTLTAS